MARTGVVGAGVIGIGVAQNLAQAGHQVTLVDVSEDALGRARADIERACRASRMLGGPAVDSVKILAAITFTAVAPDIAGAAVVIENITEDWQAKQALYRQLDQICGPETIFVANTSAIPITQIASVTSRPDKVVGVHFMNPVPHRPAVELIPGAHTSAATLEAVRALLTEMGKKAVPVNDACGFISNRVLMPTVNEAAFLVHEGVASAAAVDEVFRSCFGHPIGPLQTADLIGIDTIVNSLDVLYAHFGDPKFRSCPLLRQMAYAGQLGRKSGKGFYTYDFPGR